MDAAPARYVAPGWPLFAYARQCLVECPRCRRCAVAEAKERGSIGPSFSAPDARVTCSHCGFSRQVEHDPNGRHGYDGSFWYYTGSSWQPTVPGGWAGPSIAFVSRGRCPECGAHVFDGVVASARPGGPRAPTAQLRCPLGGHEVEAPLVWVPVTWDEPRDPMFGLPLWLQESCCGETLWAFSAEHVAALRAYVAADLRDQRHAHHWSMVARLPRWVTAAKNRDAVHRTLGRLEAKLVEA